MNMRISASVIHLSFLVLIINGCKDTNPDALLGHPEGHPESASGIENADQNSCEFVQVSYLVPENFKEMLAGYLNESSIKHRGIKSLLEISGIEFKNDAAVMLRPGDQKIIILNNEKQILIFESLLKDMGLPVDKK